MSPSAGTMSIFLIWRIKRPTNVSTFEPSSLAMEAKRSYKRDQRPWICSNKHDVAGVEEGKEATPCPVCKESFGDFLIAYLTSRLTTLGLDAENGLNRMFFKAAGVPGSISYDQFLRCLLGSHGQAGSGVRRAAGVSAKMPCTNQCTQPSVDLKEIFPKFIGDKEFKVTKIAPLLDAISQSENPAIPFNPTVLEKSFDLGNLLTYLWCDLAMLVGLKQSSSSPHSGTAGSLSYTGNCSTSVWRPEL